MRNIPFGKIIQWKDIGGGEISMKRKKFDRSESPITLHRLEIGFTYRILLKNTLLGIIHSFLPLKNEKK